MSDEIIKFNDLLKENVGDRLAKGEAVSDLERSFVGQIINFSQVDMMAVNNFAMFLTAVHRWAANSSADEFIDIIVNDLSIPVIHEEAIFYYDIFKASVDKESEAWDGLFLLVCGVWLKICDNLTLDPSFSNIKNMTIHQVLTTGLNDKVYLSYTSLVVVYSYLIGREEYEEMLPELADTEQLGLPQHATPMLLPFILMTLALLTAEFVKLNVIDNELINKWCSITHLSSNATHEEVMSAAKKFFGPRVKERFGA